ncbi:hypothetical protein CCHR01_17012 [Colletotrichum chrysophilum]|uniref:Uncharacterized protein n=1 Tax=Colletotrichum chrysophilum TaxID=1836956 RepID=A0AAD9A3C8_9PEZI|nr:hypothetical protein CCHR01_17012 [Colletotrichum chrysophilum]
MSQASRRLGFLASLPPWFDSFGGVNSSPVQRRSGPHAAIVGFPCLSTSSSPLPSPRPVPLPRPVRLQIQIIAAKIPDQCPRGPPKLCAGSCGYYCKACTRRSLASATAIFADLRLLFRHHPISAPSFKAAHANAIQFHYFTAPLSPTRPFDPIASQVPPSARQAHPGDLSRRLAGCLRSPESGVDSGGTNKISDCAKAQDPKPRAPSHSVQPPTLRRFPPIPRQPTSANFPISEPGAIASLQGNATPRIEPQAPPGILKLAAPPSAGVPLHRASDAPSVLPRHDQVRPVTVLQRLPQPVCAYFAPAKASLVLVFTLIG